jgi:DNA-binding response OmpR family regulator
MRILLIDDDQKAAGLLSRGLREEGFAVDVAFSAEQGESLAAERPHDLILLDWMLPGKDGPALCREMRARGERTPVLMLTARDALADRVTGLNDGADDYLTKPFAFEELLARVQALLRRADMGRQAPLRVADLRLDPEHQRAQRGDTPLDLTRKEFAILHIMMRQPGTTISRAHLAEQIWTTGLQEMDNRIDVHISNLRKKVDVPGLPPLIHTVRGQGFRLEAVGG